MRNPEVDIKKAAFIAEELNWWSKYVTERLTAELQRKRIKVSDDLLNSLKAAVESANANHEGAAALSFKTYGRFVDMGAGRGYHKGVPTSEQVRERVQDKRGRRPNKWYSRVAYGTLDRLIMNLVSKYQDGTLNMLRTTLNEKGL
jgi:hypothetical protein